MCVYVCVHTCVRVRVRVRGWIYSMPAGRIVYVAHEEDHACGPPKGHAGYTGHERADLRDSRERRRYVSAGAHGSSSNDSSTYIPKEQFELSPARKEGIITT